MSERSAGPSEQAAARAARRRATWRIGPLDGDPSGPDTSMIENLRRLEQLRRAAAVLRGEPYPERSTPEQRKRWPGAPIRG